MLQPRLIGALVSFPQGAMPFSLSNGAERPSGSVFLGPRVQALSGAEEQLAAPYPGKMGPGLGMEVG